MTDVNKNHLSCHNFQSWVSVNNTPLTQYDAVHDKKNNEATCWIPSEVDQAFSVSYQKTMLDEYDYVARIFLDGVVVRDTIHIGPETRHVWTVAHARVSSSERRSFIFGRATTTDDERCLGHGESVGEIRVDITKAKARRVIDDAPASGPVVTIPEVKVDERLKQGVVHQVKYGAPVEKRAPFQGKLYDKVKYDRIARFIFRYRPLEYLQAKGIAPKPPHEPIYFEIPDSPPARSTELIAEGPQRITRQLEEPSVDKIHAKPAVSLSKRSSEARSTSRPFSSGSTEQKPVVRKQEESTPLIGQGPVGCLYVGGPSRTRRDNSAKIADLTEQEEDLEAELADIKREKEIRERLKKIRAEKRVLLEKEESSTSKKLKREET